MDEKPLPLPQPRRGRAVWWLGVRMVLCALIGPRIAIAAGSPTPTPTPFPADILIGFAPMQAGIPGVGLTGPVDVVISGMAPLQGAIGFTYDPQIVLATAVRSGPGLGFVDGCTVEPNIGAAGVVTMTLTCPRGATVNDVLTGVLAEVIFKGVATGHSTLSFSSDSGIADGCFLNNGRTVCLGDILGDLPFDGRIVVAPSPPNTPTTTTTPSVTLTPAGAPTSTPAATANATATPSMSNPTATSTPPSISTPTTTATPTPSASETPTRSASACVGDCDGSGIVTVDEVLTLVNMALGNGGSCPNGLAAGVTPDVSVVVQAVNNALNGCGG